LAAEVELISWLLLKMFLLISVTSINSSA